jgi:hypothetical protein
VGLAYWQAAQVEPVQALPTVPTVVVQQSPFVLQVASHQQL